jgi:hypothetical protein
LSGVVGCVEVRRGSLADVVGCVEVRRGSLAGVVGCGRTNAVAFSDVWLGVVQGRQHQNSAAEVVGFYCHHAVYHDPQVDGSFLHFSDVVDAVRGLAVVPTME